MKGEQGWQLNSWSSAGSSARWAVRHNGERSTTVGGRYKISGHGGLQSRRALLGVGQCVDLEFQGLVVLALDLKLGLKLFDQEFEASDFGAEF
jgi:hypothetical protein